MLKAIAIMTAAVLAVFGTARGATVVYDGTAADGDDWNLIMESRGPNGWAFGQFGYFDIELTVGGDRYELSELVYSFGTSTYVSPYGFTIDGNAITLELPNARGRDLATLTLTYAEAYAGPITVAGLLAYLIESPLTGIRGLRRNGQELFDITVETPAPVPAPPALALFATGGAALYGRRRAFRRAA